MGKRQSVADAAGQGEQRRKRGRKRDRQTQTREVAHCLIFGPLPIVLASFPQLCKFDKFRIKQALARLINLETVN